LDLEAKVAASASPVWSVDEACSWLEKKGWMLTSEPYMKSKLAKVLFSATLLFKLLAEADMAIHSVSYLIREQSEDKIASQLSDKLLDRFANSLSTPISKLVDSVSTTKSFLDTTLQKQAAELLSLQESVKQQIDSAKSITESSDKLNMAHTPGNLLDPAWPLLEAMNPATPQLVHLASLLHSRGAPQTNPKVLHRISLVSKQLLIKYGPLEVNEPLRERSLQAQCDLHKTFNDWVNNCTITPDGEDPLPPSWMVHSVAIFDHPAILLEFKSDKVKESFTDLCLKNPFLLTEIDPKARI
jgi:hypothetical protein